MINFQIGLSKQMKSCNNFIIKTKKMKSKYKSTIGNSQLFNYNLVDQFVANLQENQDRSLFQSSVYNLDHQICDSYSADNYRLNAISQDLYASPIQKSLQLEIPKNNSLTDSMIRCTMGCQQRLAKSYIQILDQTDKKQEIQKKKRIEEAKKKFAQSNNHKDFIANSKPFMTSVRFSLQRPVIDNEHDSYLKTQLIFLEQPKGQSINTKDYFDKHSQNIAKKINQLGGIQDTISYMQTSLSKNEVKSFKKKQVLANMKQSRKTMFSPVKTTNRPETNNLRSSWINRSKQMRQSFMSKLQIQ